MAGNREAGGSVGRALHSGKGRLISRASWGAPGRGRQGKATRSALGETKAGQRASRLGEAGIVGRSGQGVALQLLYPSIQL